MSNLSDAVFNRAIEDRRNALNECNEMRSALLEVVRSLTPRYDPAHPEDHGFSKRTANIIRTAMQETHTR